MLGCPKAGAALVTERRLGRRWLDANLLRAAKDAGQGGRSWNFLSGLQLLLSFTSSHDR